ncbi:carboxylesterase family protein [Pseudorhodoferax sp.]|uniref:carboxylesterase family protein n=1 Tax=Pseudorhodoferax sp. TaxID=1993553 RepID=UPI0039E28AB0
MVLGRRADGRAAAGRLDAHRGRLLVRPLRRRRPAPVADAGAADPGRAGAARGRAGRGARCVRRAAAGTGGDCGLRRAGIHAASGLARALHRPGFRAPILHTLGKQARARRPAWAYEFAFPMAGTDDSSPHAADVPFVFGNTGSAHVRDKIGRPAQAAAVALAMQRCWRDFVAGGAPAGDGRWPPFDADRPAVMRFGLEGATIAVPRTPATDGFWPHYFAGPRPTPRACPPSCGRAAARSRAVSPFEAGSAVSGRLPPGRGVPPATSPAATPGRRRRAGA